MQLTFQDKRIRSICEVEKVGRDVLGDQAFEQLQVRLADLIAATDIHELPIALIPQKLDSDELLIDLTSSWGLIVRENRRISASSSRSHIAFSPSLKLLRVERRHDQ